MYTESLCRWHWWCIAARSISQTILVPLSSDSYNPDSCVCLSVIMKGFFPRKESRPAERERHNASQRVYTAVRSQILGHVPQLARFDSPWVSHTNATRRNMPAAERCAASSLTCVCLFHFQMWEKSEKKKERKIRSCSAYLFRCCAAPRAPSGEFSSFRLLLLAGYARCRLDPINLLKKARTASASTPHLPLRRRSQGKKNTRGARKQTSMTSLNVE